MKQQIAGIDVLRGLALLGILLQVIIHLLWIWFRIIYHRQSRGTTAHNLGNMEHTNCLFILVAESFSVRAIGMDLALSEPLALATLTKEAHNADGWSLARKLN